jgi:hypothetical protein
MKVKLRKPFFLAKNLQKIKEKEGIKMKRNESQTILFDIFI